MDSLWNSFACEYSHQRTHLDTQVKSAMLQIIPLAKLDVDSQEKMKMNSYKILIRTTVVNIYMVVLPKRYIHNTSKP